MIAESMITDPSTKQLEGCVVSEHTTATDIGIACFEQGGNAIDAVVATILAVGTLCPYHSDIGGSGFALVRTSDGEHHALSFRGCAPVRSILTSIRLN
jgi:gamma-glutamyltranspeptidase/glutathione hydrolase